MNIDELISSATASGGNDVDRRERERATAALLASPDVARTCVLERLDEGRGAEAALALLLGVLRAERAAVCLLRLLLFESCVCFAALLGLARPIGIRPNCAQRPLRRGG